VVAWDSNSESHGGRLPEVSSPQVCSGRENATRKSSRLGFSSGFAHGDYKNKDRSSFRSLDFLSSTASLKALGSPLREDLGCKGRSLVKYEPHTQQMEK
jgi:hypothetical protein